MIQLIKADILLFKGGSTQAEIIRWFEKYPGNPAIFGHAAACVQDGDWWTSLIDESLTTVKQHSPASEYAGSTTQITIYRSLELTDSDREEITEYVNSKVGTLYNFGMLPLQAVDGLLSKIFRRNIVFARRVAMPAIGSICSVLVAMAYWKVKGWTFGLPARAANPDNIGDYCAAHPEKYQKICELAVIPKVKPT